MDLTTLLGLFIGIVGIFAGNALEGGHFSALIQFTAFVIVFGGTFGATIVSNTKTDIMLGIELTKWAFSNKADVNKAELSEKLLEFSRAARKDSIKSVEKKIKNFSMPFLRNVLRMVVDGVDAHIVREVFEREIDVEEERLHSGARIWLDAGGFAPTIGIIGAVLGLIHVMANLADPSQLGKGIAVAFVATIYGVASANLIFLPIGNKIKNKIAESVQAKEMILDAAIAISKNHSPMVIEQMLQTYTNEPRVG